MSNDNDPHTAPTQPAQRAVAEVPVRRGPITNVEILDAVASMKRELLADLGDVKREMRDVRNEHSAQRDELQAQRSEINALKTRPPAARAPLQSYSDIGDNEAVSGNVLREAMQKQKRDQEALEKRQSLELEAQTLRIQAEAKAAMWKPVLATVSAIILGLAGQYFAARGTITAEVKESTKEAVREAAPVVREAAKEAVKESQKESP